MFPMILQAVRSTVLGVKVTVRLEDNVGLSGDPPSSRLRVLKKGGVLVGIGRWLRLLGRIVLGTPGNRKQEKDREHRVQSRHAMVQAVLQAI